MSVKVNIKESFKKPVDQCASCGSNSPTQEATITYFRLIPLLVVNIQEKFNLHLPVCDTCAPYFKEVEKKRKLYFLLWVFVLISAIVLFSLISAKLFSIIGAEVFGSIFAGLAVISAIALFALLIIFQQLSLKVANTNVKKNHPTFNSVRIRKSRVVTEGGYIDDSYKYELLFENNEYGNKFKALNDEILD